MEKINGRDITVKLMQLSMGIFRWNKAYIESYFTINGRPGRLDLTIHQFQVLSFLYDNLDINTISGLSEELYISRSSLSLMISKLEKTGHLRKETPQKEDDGRKVYLYLTEKGRMAVEEAREGILERTSAVFDQLEGESKALLYSNLTELNELIISGGLKL